MAEAFFYPSSSLFSSASSHTGGQNENPKKATIYSLFSLNHGTEIHEDLKISSMRNKKSLL